MVTKIKNMIVKRYLNILCFGMCIVFFIYALATLFIFYSNEVKAEKRINAMLEYCNTLNSKIEENKNTIIPEDNSSLEQIYFDGKTAILDSYNKTFINANSYLLEASGKLSLSANAGTFGNVYLNMQANFNIAQFSKDKIYEEIKANTMDTNLSIVKQYAKKANKKLLENGKKQVIKSEELGFKNNQVTANFDGCSPEEDNEALFWNECLYNITEETIQNISYFKVKKKNEKIDCYYVQVELDVKSAEKYAEYLGEIAGQSVPVFNKVILTVVIDNKGYIKSLHVSDKYTLTVSGFKANGTSSITYYVKNINKPIEYNYTGF